MEVYFLKVLKNLNYLFIFSAFFPEVSFFFYFDRVKKKIPRKIIKTKLYCRKSKYRTAGYNLGGGDTHTQLYCVRCIVAYNINVFFFEKTNGTKIRLDVDSTQSLLKDKTKKFKWSCALKFLRNTFKGKSTRIS